MKPLIIIAMLSSLAMTSCSESRSGMAEYAGEDLTGRLEITVDPQSGNSSIRVEVPGPWKLYAGRSTELVDFSRTVAEGDGAGTFDIGAPDTARLYYQFVWGENKAILAERHLPMQGGYNFRDLGGYRTLDGRYVKWGLVFRSDDMHGLTDRDLGYLSSIPLQTVVDFRSASEADSMPDRLAQSVVNYVPLRISPGDLSAVPDVGNLTAAETAGFMEEMNRMLVGQADSQGAYIDFFRALASPGQTPLMFHCSAGKDRTGMGAALFLSALGVPRETVMEDYLLSNTYLRDKYAGVVAAYPQLAPMMEVRREYLEAGLDYISDNYGSVEAYLRVLLSVDTEKLKEMYLY